MNRSILRSALGATALLVFGGAAQAADLYRAAPAVAPAAAPTAIPAYAFNWTGFYVGANLGGRWLQDRGNIAGNPYGLNSTSFVGGLQGGYNYQIGNIVLGLEADVDYGRNSRTSLLATGDQIRTRLDWSGSVRGRAGYAFDRFLVYGTGGLAWANFDTRGTDAAGNTSSSSRTRAGWTVGGGLEYAVTNNVSVRGEYLYADYGSPTISYPGTAVGTHRETLTSHLARIGVNWKF